MVNGLNIINCICNFIVNHPFSVISLFELFTYILSMETLKSGLILDQNYVGSLKWANGPYLTQICTCKLHNLNGPFEISMGPLQNLMGPKSLISIF